MPIHEVTLANGSKGYQWGNHGAKYAVREDAVKQAAAARANGYAGDTRGDFRKLIAGLVKFFQEEADEGEEAVDTTTNAAGVVVRDPNGSVLFLKRSATGDHQGEWALPAGGAEGDETPDLTALRELLEETGYRAKGLVPLHAQTMDSVNFATFFHDAAQQFVPKLNDEHTEYKWAPPSAPPEPLHPGVKAALALTLPAFPVHTAEDAMAFDRDSVRRYDNDGRLHVEVTNISKANVCPYRGKEIPNNKALGLDPERIYELLRDPVELEKGAATFNNLPLLSAHVPVTAASHPKELTIGTTGSDAVFVAPFLRNSIAIWPQYAISAVENEDQKELSCSYRYRADMTPGTYQGVRYDGVMRDIVGNHVALVKKGRAGSDVVVGDSALEDERIPPMPKTRVGAYVHGALSTFFKTAPSTEAQLALDSAVGGLTADNLVSLKPKIKDALKDIKAKYANDADLDGMHGFIDRLDKAPVEDKAKDESPEEKAEREKKAAADKAAKDAAEAFQNSAEYKGAKDAYDKKAADGKAKDAEPKKEEGVTKQAMDEAIAAATKTATDSATTIQRGIREAERAVAPWVGTLAMDAASGDDIYRAALTSLGVTVDGVHPSAFPALLKLTPKPGEQSVSARKPVLAFDAAAAKSFAERYPGAARTRTIG